MACLRTYAGLCIYSKAIHPSIISERLGIDSTRSLVLDPSSRYKHRREQHFWHWSTKDLVDSTNHIDHLKTIFAQLSVSEHVLDELRNEGCKTSVSCYWDSDGQGGPWLDVATVDALSRLRLEVWWDIYFTREDEADDCRDDSQAASCDDGPDADPATLPELP